MKISLSLSFKFAVLLINLIAILSSNNLVAHQSKAINKVSHFHSAYDDTLGNISAFLSELKSAYDENRQPEFNSSTVTTALENKISSIWKTMQFYPTAHGTDSLHSSRVDSNRYEVRNIPINFYDKSNVELTDYMVLELNNNYKIVDLRLGVSTDDFNELIASNDEQEKRKVLNVIQSIEAIKTAYYFKNFEDFQRIFSSRPSNQTSGVTPHGEFNSTNHSSDSLTSIEQIDYMGELDSDLKNNEWIHLNYEKIQIVKHDTQGDIYAVNLLQYYNFSGRQISGYVFYLFDTYSDSAPQLLMQVWQNFEDTSEDEIFTLDDIEIL